MRQYQPKTKTVAFVGTPSKVPLCQLDIISQFIAWINPTKLIHGGCVGSEEQIHELGQELGISKIVVYPSTNISKQANLDWKYIRKPMPPKKRDELLVDHCSILIAAPDEYQITRNRAWRLMQRAQAQYKIVEIAWKDCGMGIRRPSENLGRIDR